MKILEREREWFFVKMKLLVLLLVVMVFMMLIVLFVDIIEGELIVILGENLFE